MKIQRAYTILTCPGRNFVTLKIVTGDGVYGVGDATLNGRELAVKAYLDEHVIPCLIGRDSRSVEDIWQYLYRGAYWRRGPVTMAAIAAVDMALWDIKGKRAGMPVYQLLGGRSRHGVMVYGHANGRDHGMTPIEAARLGKDLEPYRLFWLEDATPAENQEAFRLIRQHTTTPLAVGEIFNSIWDCKDLIREQLIDYIRAAVVHAGGITHLRRIADFASVYQVRTGCHGATDLSPVCMAAAVNFGLWVPNFGIQEYMRHTPETDAVFPHNYRFEDGFMIMDEVPW